MISGAEAMVKCLEHEGVSVVFGYPGAAICPFYDCLSTSQQIRHILVRQEQNGGHAASGYARIAKKPGVCIATSGPGATNLITALATAYMDSIPLIAITGQVATDVLGRDVFQEADITGAAEPFTKHSYLVKDASDLPRVFKEAFYIASTGRPGPVLIDVPIDVQKQNIEFKYPKQVEIIGYRPTTKGHPLQIKKVAEALSHAQKPLLCVGGGAFLSDSCELVVELAEKLQIPVVSTMMGLGVFPSDHPLYLGMLGMHGVSQANKALMESDVLIIMGARVGDRAVSSLEIARRGIQIIHIDIDPAEIGKNVGTAVPLVGNAKIVLRQLLDCEITTNTAEWREELSALKAQYCPDLAPRQNFINPKAFLRLLSEKLDEDAVYVADVGQNQIWAANHLVIKQHRFLTTGGMGTMGYSLPAAMGAKLAAPQRQVVASCGDGSFQMMMMELATMCQHNVPVKIVLFCNDKLGMVKEIQQNSYGKRYIATSLEGNPSFVQLAKAYGIGAEEISSLDEAPAAIHRMLGEPGCYLLCCRVDPDESSI